VDRRPNLVRIWSSEAAMPNKGVIAIVDDDPSVREGLTDLLNSVGFVTATFRSAEAFLAADRLQSTACLITDGRMSGMTGFELHGHLIASGQRIPTILITAFAEDADRARALRAGMSCYLPKPFNGNDLLAYVCSAISSRPGGAGAVGMSDREIFRREYSTAT
jgi:FixJ family two-component response regulator